MPSLMNRTQSDHAFERACRVLVGGVNSPVRAFGSVGGNPVFVESASGAHIIDVDGHRYIDLVGSWGPAILGHAHPEVVEAVKAAADRGLSFGACCETEAQLGELVVEALPSMEMVRFVNSGTEATMSAMRLARAATQRDRIIKFSGCYHGHADAMLVASGSGGATFGVPDSAGVPKEVGALTLLAPYNDLEAVAKILKKQSKDVAAIIVEPIAGNMGMVHPVPGFLEGLRALCDEHGCLLIFDEVMTGFRVAWGGYQNVCDVRPDITCLGKVIGGGMPVAAYGASRELMQRVSPLGPTYQAGTLSGNPLGMAAGIATMQLCKQDGFYERLENKCTRLLQGIDEAWPDHIAFGSSTTGGMFGFRLGSSDRWENFDDAQALDHALYGRFFHAMLDRGVWLPPSGYEAMFMSAAHTDAMIDEIIAAASASIREVVA